MRPGTARFKTTRRAVADTPFARRHELFDPWLRVPEDFGRPARNRLFSPLARLLAFSRPGARAGSGVRGSP